jgi:hypothetical protein
VIRSIPIGMPGSGLGQFLAPRFVTADLRPLIRGAVDLEVAVDYWATASRVVVENLGPNPAAAVELTVQIPQGVNFVSARPSQGGCATPAFGASGIVRCALGALAPAEKAHLKVDVTGAAGKLRATASDIFNDDNASGSNVVEWSVNTPPPPVFTVVEEVIENFPVEAGPPDFRVERVGNTIQVRHVSGEVQAPWVTVELPSGVNPSPEIAQWMGCETPSMITYPLTIRCPLVARYYECPESEIPGVCRVGSLGSEIGWSVGNYNTVVTLGTWGEKSDGTGYPSLPRLDIVAPVVLAPTEQARSGEILAAPVTVTVTDRDGQISRSLETTLAAVALIENAKELGWFDTTDEDCRDGKMAILLGSCQDSWGVQLARRITVVLAAVTVAAVTGGWTIAVGKGWISPYGYLFLAAAS